MRTLFIAVLVLSCFAQCSPDPDPESKKLTYDVVFRGSSAGVYEKVQLAENHFEYRYNYTDRGRGPEVSEASKKCIRS